MIRRLLLAAALLVAVPAVAAPPGAALDGYRFERAEYEHDRQELIFVPVKTQADLEKVGAAYGIKFGSDHLKGFAIRTATGCAIYALDPRVSYEPEFLGHELAHCIYGNFHPEEDKIIK